MKQHEAQAFWITEPGVSEIRSHSLNAPGSGQVRVRTLYSGISRGTENLVFQGAVPVNQYQLMRAPFQEGDFPAPVKYGYSNVGVVEEGCQSFIGCCVFCLYPHQSVYIVPADAVLPVPTTLPPARAILAANMETAINGLWDATPRLGDRIVVIGAGTVGCLVAYLAARLPGCQVQIIDVDTTKATVATALGITFNTPDDLQGDADLVIHASGNPAGLVTALNAAAADAMVLEMSWFGDQPVSLPLGEAFHSKRLMLRSSQVGQVALGQRHRWTYRRRLELALSLLSDPVLDILISGESSFLELPQTMVALAASSSGVLCHRVIY
jgi:D-arabinose 1-dehydrogenase-like Zn-dependent alcohol dehydrogenase